MIESRLNDYLSLSPPSPPLSPSPPPSLRLEISPRRAVRIDTGRSNKAGRLWGHRGVAHTVTPEIFAPPPRIYPGFTACLIY